MSDGRLQALEAMYATNPDDTRVLFALANEYEKREDWDRVASFLNAYLERADDEGNAWGRLGFAYVRLGRTEDARRAYEQGIETSNRNGHPTMATEFEEALADIAG